MVVPWLFPWYLGGCYKPKFINLSYSITSAIFCFFWENAMTTDTRRRRKTETNPNPVSKQAGGKHLNTKSVFHYICMLLLHYFGTVTVAAKLSLRPGTELPQNIKRLALSISWKISRIHTRVHPVCSEAQQPSTDLLVDNLNIVDPEIPTCRCPVHCMYYRYI